MVKLVGLLVVLAILALGSLIYYQKQQQTSVKNDEVVLTPLKMQLNWKHQSQFAGNYLAKDKGYYANAGLDVEFFERTTAEKASVADQLEQGQIDIGILSPWELMSEIQNGKKLVAIASIYEQSPAVVISLQKSKIKSPSDLKNKKLGTYLSNIYQQKFYEFLLKRANVATSSAKFVQLSENPLDDLIKQKVDVISGYRTIEAFMLEQQNQQISLLRPEDFDIDLYDDVYVVTEKTAAEKPELLTKFMKVTQKGWQEGFQNKKEAVEITKKYASEGSNDKLFSFILEQSEPLIIPTEGQPIGMMNYAQWKKLHDYLNEVELTEKDLDITKIFTNKFVQ